MEATLLERGKKYSYKYKKIVTYSHFSSLDGNKYVFKGIRGGEIKLSLNQVTNHISEYVEEEIDAGKVVYSRETEGGVSEEARNI